ncbi:MAG: transglycosylase SLT domain-containing protein [Bdellovibrionales bacterium]|nr:transglycosylase SLT domain-containing protein [Bdellovibrionales bacterium]
MQIRRVFSLFIAMYAFVISPDNSYAKPELLSASFPKPKKLNKILPPEYQVYLKIKPLLENTKDLASIEASERQLLTYKMDAETRLLDKEFDEMFAVLEIRRAEKFSQLRKWNKAMESFQRGYANLANFKFPYYWLESSSRALSDLCKRNKKKKDESCLTIARKVVDMFPRNAKETKVLRELPSIDTLPSSEMGTERLSQTYTEKIEKDEESFQLVLQAFLKPQDADLLKLGKEFIELYPKSILRYRTQFLMAEYLFKKNNKDDAKRFYESIINDTPLGFYAVIAAERLGVNLRDRVKKDPIKIDRDGFGLSLGEKRSLERLQQLYDTKHFEETQFEFEAFARTRSYSTDLLIYLMSLATRADQNLNAFRIANELIQRRYDGLLNQEIIEIIFPERYMKEIETSAIQSRIDPLLVASLTKQESGFRANILSSSGALGLMQLMPFTALDVDDEVPLHNLKDPKTNIRLGTQYLASLMDKYNNNVIFSLAAYNAGPNRVSKWRKDSKVDADMIEFIESIPFRETRDYVMSILRNRYWYQYRKGYPLKSTFEYWTTGVVPATPSPSVTPTSTAK